MSITDEIFSLLRKGREMTADIDELRSLNTRSITKGANEATFQFPIITTDNISVPMASAITRNMERVYASFTQSWLSMNPMIDVTIDRTPLDYLKKFHQNIKLEGAIEEDLLSENSERQRGFMSFMESTFPELEVPEDALESVIEGAYNGDYKLFLDRTGSYGIAFKESVCSKYLSENNKELLKEHLSQFDLKPFQPTTFTEAKSTTKTDIVSAMVDGANQKAKNDEAIRNANLTGNLKTPQLLDRDVKKSNDIQPFALQIRLMAVNDKKEFIQYLDFVLGIKAVLHLLKSDEIVTNLSYVLQNKSFMFKLLKWTTGEISLFKDLLFNIDEIKFDVNNRTKGHSPWFSTLKRLKAKKVTFGTFGVHKLVPNSTLVVSSYEVELVKKNTGVDLRDVSAVKKIMDKLFLIAFIIVDDGTETVDIIYDYASSYQTYALETLEREISLSSNKLGKEIGRMISR